MSKSKSKKEVATVDEFQRVLDILATAALQRSEPARYLYLVETLPELHRRELGPLWLELVANQEAENALVERILELTGDGDGNLSADAERMLMDFKAAAEA